MALCILRKKKFIYIIGVVSIAVISLLAPYKLGAGGVSYSVMGCIMNRDHMELGGLYDAFSTGTYFFWFYILAPLITSVPVLSYISDASKGGFDRMERMRTGRIKYILMRIGWMTAGCACTLFLGMILHTISLLPFYPLSEASIYPGDMADTSVSGNLIRFAFLFLKKYLYMLGYSYIVSTFAACILFLYNDLLFVMSIAFVAVYVIRDWFFHENVLEIIVPALILSFMLLLIGKRGDRV